MSTPPKPIPHVLTVLHASAIKRVLIVEGPEDKAVYTKWLEKLAHPNLFSLKVEIIDAGGGGEGGGKSVVLKALEWFRQQGGGNLGRVFGLIDRDEWDMATVQQKSAQFAQLRVNPSRHALESYFADPSEIGPTLTNHNTVWAPAVAQLAAQMAAQLPRYVDHWALLATTDRLKTRLREQGYPGHFATTIPIPADADILQRFQQWAGMIDATANFQAFDQLRQTAAAASQAVQCRSHTWAKTFFENVVLPAPNGLLGLTNQSALDWMVDLAEWGAVPGDIAALLHPLLS